MNCLGSPRHTSLGLAPNFFLPTANNFNVGLSSQTLHQGRHPIGHIYCQNYTFMEVN